MGKAFLVKALGTEDAKDREKPVKNRDSLSSYKLRALLER